MSRFYTYDLETYPNCFLFTGKFLDDPTLHKFEISPRINQRTELLAHLDQLASGLVLMVGYNSLGFDYPIIHELMTNPYTFDEKKASLICNEIITGGNYGTAGSRNVYLGNRLIPQVDLAKINHFDNPNRRTSLKSLEFAMRLKSVEDLPFPIRDLNYPEMDVLSEYNNYDVYATEKFLGRCMHLIEMRQDLLNQGVLAGDVLNFSDVKIGVEYLIKRIGRAKCFVKGSTPKQSIRSRINFNNIILPKIYFRTEPYQAVLDWFKSQTIDIDNLNNPSLETTLAKVQFQFGVGGIHASVENKYYESTEDFVIKDIDVTGMYVSVAVANNLSPEHLGDDFTIAYKQLQQDRAQYPKGTSMNAVLKLAGNGVYGNSNNEWSCFYDPKYMYSVTVNGQLQLLQLVELISLIPKLKIIQVNTDGITVHLPRKLEHLFDLWCRHWEGESGLKLEEVEYSRMWISDVNNYMAETKDGKLKRKGKYWYPTNDREYEGVWNKDFSNMSAQKGIEQVLTKGWPVEDVVRLISNPFDFMLRYKTPGGAKVYLGDTPCSKTVRYYVSTSGQPMKKVAKPKGEIGDWKRKHKLTDSYYNKIKSEIPKGAWDERINTKNKKKNTEVTTSIQAGKLVKECNIAKKFNWNDVDWEYYIAEIKKLQLGEQNV